MKRWVVRVTKPDFTFRWEAIGVGLTDDVQLAHLYTKKSLADKKAEHYQWHIDVNPGQWYLAVEIIEVEVIFPKGV